MLEMPSGLGATTMGIGVSHSNPSGDSVTSGCRLRAHSQGQQQTPSQQQTSEQSDQTLQECQTAQKDAQRQNPSHSGRTKKDNCCLCWCCCCSCSNKCLAAVGTGNETSGTGDSKKKRGNSGIGADSASGGLTDKNSGTGNGLDGLDAMDGSGMECCGLDEVRSWGSSFDKLMRSATGRKLFREFLISEYSEENIAFWLACEQLKLEDNPDKIEEKARYIYEDYISILSPKEVSLDSRVREIVNRNMGQPTPHTFDEAQLQIYTLMHRDSYPRFVNSDIFRRVARLGSGPPSPADDSGGIVAAVGAVVAPAIPSVGKPKSKKSIS